MWCFNECGCWCDKVGEKEREEGWIRKGKKGEREQADGADTRKPDDARTNWVKVRRTSGQWGWVRCRSERFQPIKAVQYPPKSDLHSSTGHGVCSRELLLILNRRREDDGVQVEDREIDWTIKDEKKMSCMSNNNRGDWDANRVNSPVWMDQCWVIVHKSRQGRM